MFLKYLQLVHVVAEEMGVLLGNDLENACLKILDFAYQLMWREGGSPKFNRNAHTRYIFSKANLDYDSLPIQ